ncbi:MAG: T9SS type A sorting domain-containing protein [Flavobacteriales bacterium]
MLRNFIFNSIYLVVLTITSIQLSAQRGKNGNFQISANAIVNEYTLLTANALAGDQQIVVSNALLNANNRFPQSLGTGDLIMIIQMQGATIDGSDIFSDTWGNIVDYGTCGNYELIEVKSVQGNVIQFFCGLKNNYSSSGRTQVVRVPRYNNLTINNGGSLNGQFWNGSLGGVIAIETSGDLIINGRINAIAIGFRGGLANENQSFFGGTRFADLNPGEGAEKGESIAGNTTDYDQMGGRYCKGAPANGGGGGTSHNAGGGGGSNAALGAYNGLGNPNISTSNWITAWNQESPGFSSNVSSGGGRGGYSFSGVNQNPLTLGPNSQTWQGDWRRNEGGRGGRPLSVAPQKLFLGGGGGAGDQNDNLGGNGGNGGGIIYIENYGSISGTGEIVADGGNGGNSGAGGFTSGIDGCGGAGGGGAIMIRSMSPIPAITINARGGNGGNQIMNLLNNTQAQGPGGGGGGGVVYHTGGNPVINVSGGNNGTTNSASLTAFHHNGATSGGIGAIAEAPPLFDVNYAVDGACIGGDATITGTVSGNAGGANIEFDYYDSNLNLLGSGQQLVLAELSGPMQVIMLTCNGNQFRNINIVPTPPPAFSLGQDREICLGDSVFLQSNTEFPFFSWEPSTGLTQPESLSTFASPQNTTTYVLSAFEQVGCVGRDTIVVQVNPLPDVSISAPTSACLGDTITVSVSGASTYSWSGNSIIGADNQNLVEVAAISNLSLSLIASNEFQCQINQQVQILVFEPAQVYISEDQTICDGQAVELSASGAVSYEWFPTDGLSDPNVANPLALPSQSIAYFVNFIDVNNCSGQAGPISVTVGANINPTFTFDQIDNYNVNFTCTTPNADEIIWIIQGSTFIGSQVSYNFPFEGFFNITLIVGNDCGYDTLTSTIEVLKLSVRDIAAQISYVIYPNPANELVQIEFNTVGKQQVTLSLLDIKGTLVKRNAFQLNGGKQIIQLELNELAGGIYLMQLQAKDGQAVLKLFIVR